MIPRLPAASLQMAGRRFFIFYKTSVPKLNGGNDNLRANPDAIFSKLPAQDQFKCVPKETEPPANGLFAGGSWRSSRDLNPGGAVNTLRDFESRLFDHLSTAPTFVSGQAARFVRPACRHVIYYTSFGAPRQSKIRPRQGRGRKTQRSFKRRNGAAPGLSRSPLRRRCPASRTRSRRCPYRRTDCRPRSPAAASQPGSGKRSGRCSSR